MNKRFSRYNSATLNRKCACDKDFPIGTVCKWSGRGIYEVWMYYRNDLIIWITKANSAKVLARNIKTQGTKIESFQIAMDTFAWCLWKKIWKHSDIQFEEFNDPWWAWSSHHWWKDWAYTRESPYTKDSKCLSWYAWKI